MPIIIRFYIRNCIWGFVLAGVFVALLLYFNVANLWHLISTSDVGSMALFVFWMLNGIVFSGVQTGVALALMADHEDDGENHPGGGAVAMVSVPVKTHAEKTQR
ncbi:MAG: hypothetical protein AAF755_08200 [Pseudomonadota bacterium]